MKLKKTITGMLLIVIFLAQISIIPFNDFVYAEESQNNTKFHYQQLDSVGKKVYDGIYDMYMQGIMKKGTESFDLAKDDKYVTQEQLESYTKGNLELKKAMNAARYAFYADYPEVFYLNFQKLTLRVTKDSENRYHANIGSGNLKDYYVEGFTSEQQVEEAIQAFEARANEIANGAKNINVEQGSNLVVQQIKYVHNEIIYNTSYRLESDCEEGNEGYLGTPYGALVKKQAVCEGYARALKVILDKLGINNILVQGTHQSEGSAAVPHMWNYVEIEKETNTRAIEKIWYAVDATLDDPFLRNDKMDKEDPTFKPGDDLVEGFENTRYCMVGTETMNREHTPIGIIEAAGNYQFQYPELNTEDYGIDTVINNNGLIVKFKQEGTEGEDYKAGDFYISYNNKGYAEAREEGKYILMKYHSYRPGDEIWLEGNWGYMDPEPYVGGFIDYGDHIYITVPNSEYVEFAVTTLPPSSGIAGLTYQGDESDFVAQTGKLYNPNGTYKGRPYVKKQTPPATEAIVIGPTYHVDVTYDDDLVLEEGATEVGYRIESTGVTGAEKSTITNFQFDGKCRVTFDLKFSEMYADDSACYDIYLTGAVGKNSGKTPMPITFGASHVMGCVSRMSYEKNWNLFARPFLLENEDLSMNGWQTSDGEPVSDKLISRIALVTTRTTKTEKDAMTNLMEEELPSQELITSETYNISLNICRQNIVKTGHRVRIALGFPAGYGPDDAGVTFKAYHFKRDAQGNVTGVEEIPCVITPYGLIVTCDSFSPFAVAVVENDGTQTEQNKAVVVSATEGGKITGANREEGNIITLEPNQSKTVSVRADEGYEIETLTVCGEEVDMTNATNKDAMDVSVAYNDIKDGNCIVEATFVAKSVVATEEQNGEVAVRPTVTPVSVSIPTEMMASLNRKLVINSNVGNAEGTYTYQWYKDGVKLEGKTNKTLTIDSVTREAAGKYTLKVTNTVETVSEETISNECTVIVSELEVSIVPKEGTVDLENLVPGTEFEVNANIDNISNVGKGIVSLAGQLEYDSDILQRISITGNNGWSLEDNSFNEQNFKFVTDNDKFITEAGQMFTMKFKVKDTVKEETQTSIKIKGITASGGYGVIGAGDAEIAINVQIPEPVEEKITSDVYVIDDQNKDISRILPETTVRQFKQNVTTEQEMVFIDESGNILGEESIIGTGTTIKVGKTLQYTLVVTGDADGDGEITINDLAKIKLHLIEYELLTGIPLKAIDVDYDKEITVNDIAQIKLVLIGLMQIK